MTKTLLLILTVLILKTINVLSIQCYKCSGAIGQEGDCDYVGPGSPTMTCDKRYCYSYRIDFKDPKDKLASISRACVDDRPCLDDISEDSSYRYYCTLCEKDLCNGGDGRAESESDNNKIDDGYGTLRVPGRGNGNTHLPNILLLLLTFVITKKYLI